MGFLDRLLGRSGSNSSIPGMTTGGGTPRGYESPAATTYPQASAGPGNAPTDRDPDEVAIQRYRYMLRTAPPEDVELAHAEAFAQLTPEQRRRVLDELGSTVPPSERATSDDPQSLARMATRAEVRNPGTLENSFRGNSPGQGPGFGSMVGSSMLGTVAGVVIGSTVANAMFGPMFGDPSTPVAEDAAADAGGGEGADSAGADAAGADAADADPGADAGGDEGLFGGLFGGGGGDGGGGLGDFFGGGGDGGGGGFDF